MEKTIRTKEFKTYGQALKWVNKQIKDTDYHVVNADIQQEKHIGGQIIAMVEIIHPEETK